MWSLLVLSLFATSALALYPSRGNVIELTPDNFDRLVINSDEVWLVEFYAPWCGHCKLLVPEFTKAANGLKGVVKVGAVDADKHRDLGGKYGVSGFPTLKIFGVNKQKPEDFNGERTAEKLAEGALKAVRALVNVRLGGGGGSSDSDSSSSDDVIELTDANFDKLVLQSEDLWLVEFYAPWCGHCKNLAPHWAKAATQLKGKVKLGALDATAHKVQASKYGIQGYPTIKYFPPGKKTADSAENYEGGRTATDIVNWALDKHSENVPAPEILQLINEAIFDEACKSKPLCVVAILPHILDCQSECRNKYLDILEEMGEKFKKKLWGWVWSEGGAQPALEEALELGGFGYPAMAVVNTKKMKYSVLRGAFSSQGISEFLRDLSYGRGNTAPIRGEAVPKIEEVGTWDGQDAAPPQEEDIDLSDVDLDEKDEL